MVLGKQFAVKQISKIKWSLLSLFDIFTLIHGDYVQPKHLFDGDSLPNSSFIQ